MVSVPPSLAQAMFMLGCVTQEEADSWLKAINDVAANSSKTVGTTSDINTLTDYEDSDFEEDDKTTGVEQSVGRTRLSTPGSSNRKNSVGMSKIIKESFLYRRNPHPPLIPKAPFYALGWNKRFFCLDSIGRLEWFKSGLPS